VRLNTPLFVQGQTGTIAVSLDSLGDENALSFSLNFDATRLAFVNASVVDAASNAILNINAKQAAQGHLGFVLALPSNQSFAAGSSQLIQASFRALPLTSGAAAIAFADQPVPRGVSDPNAVALAADYINAAIPVSARPSLKIVAGSNSFNLSWPTSPGGFVLQDSTDLKFTPTSWTTVTTTPVTSNGDNLVSLSASPTNKFYRLYHP
jgi:hypothetical protein